jgi:hypothetical protein
LLQSPNSSTRAAIEDERGQDLRAWRMSLHRIFAPVEDDGLDAHGSE